MLLGNYITGILLALITAHKLVRDVFCSVNYGEILGFYANDKT